MEWWTWIALGGALLIAEMLVGGQLWLFFIAAAAILVGIISFVFPDLPLWYEVGAFAVLAMLLVLGLRRQVKTRFFNSRGYGSIVGEVARIEVEIAAGGYGKAELRGTQWDVHNLDQSPLRPGQRARVVEVSNLVLSIRADDGPAEQKS